MGKNILILFYNRTEAEHWKFMQEEFPPGFQMTTDTKRFDEAQVVVFYLPTLKLKGDLIKRPGQLWVAWCTECEKHYPQYTDPDIEALFDLRMGYHSGADIYTPYVYPRYECHLRKIDGLQPKPGLINMFISSPFNLSRRLEYLAELQNWLPIDSYGGVMHNKDLPVDYGIMTKKEIVSTYKFTIAFENSIDRDYVTEKFFEPLLMGSVPIYLGAPNVTDFAPGEHCFIDVRDFDSVKHLADYLIFLSEHASEYQAYFEWKNRPYMSNFQKVMNRLRQPLADRFCDVVEQQLNMNRSI